MFSQYASRILSASPSQDDPRNAYNEAPLFNHGNGNGSDSDSDSDADMGPSSQFLSRRPNHSNFSMFRGVGSPPNDGGHGQLPANADSVYGAGSKRFWISSLAGSRLKSGSRPSSPSLDTNNKRRISQVSRATNAVSPHRPASAADYGNGGNVDLDLDEALDDPAFGMPSGSGSGSGSDAHGLNAIDINTSTSTAGGASFHSNRSVNDSPTNTHSDNIDNNMHTVQLDEQLVEDHDAPPEDLTIERPKQQHMATTTANLSIHGDSIPTTTVPINSAMLDQSSSVAPQRLGGATSDAFHHDSRRDLSRNLSSYSYYNNGDASVSLKTSDPRRNVGGGGPSGAGAIRNGTGSYGSSSAMSRPALYSMSYDSSLYPNWSYAFWSCVCLACATSAIVWLTTEAPSSYAPGRTPKIIGDSVYDLLSSSSRLLLTDTIVALILAGLWLFCMRRFSQLSLLGLVIVVPAVLFSMGMYAMVMSYRSAYGGYTGGDKLLRFFAWLLLVAAGVWAALMYYSRAELDSALCVIRRACSVVNENIQLLAVTLATIGTVILVTVVWTGMFRLLFLEGRLIKGHWILDSRVWLVASLYVILYLWACGAISSAQRCIIAGVTAHWVFYGDNHIRTNPFRHLSGSALIKVHVHRCLAYQMGLVCFSSFIVLMTRIPMLVAPSRMSRILQHGFRLSSTLTLVSSPLTLTMATICNMPLDQVCERLSRSPLPTSTNNFPPTPASGLYSSNDTQHEHHQPSPHNHTHNQQSFQRATTSAFTYNLAKVLLTTSRATMAIIFSIGAWVHASMYYKYAYILGLLAGFIGWIVLGAMESTLGATLDALYVCENLYG